jgi:site-specific DNA-cytosine methylase
MKVLELFAGSRSIGKVCDSMNIETFSTDIVDFKKIDYVCDIFDFDYDKVPFVPDVIWCSPPCTGFSVACIGRNWVKGEPFTPKTESAKLGIKILEKTLEIIEYYKSINPKVTFFIENPRGKMRKAPYLQPFFDLRRETVTYCQYASNDELPRMKPTDIWTNEFLWKPKKPCKNGDTCHIAAPRGSQTGTQGLKGNYERSKIPKLLCEEIISSAHKNWVLTKKKYF